MISKGITTHESNLYLVENSTKPQVQIGENISSLHFFRIGPYPFASRIVLVSIHIRALRQTDCDAPCLAKTMYRHLELAIPEGRGSQLAMPYSATQGITNPLQYLIFLVYFLYNRVLCDMGYVNSLICIIVYHFSSKYR